MEPASSKHKKIKEQKRPKSPPGHPPYLKMITEAIVALKERTGSSQYAIAKFIEEKHKDHLPAYFKKVLLFQLKKSVADGKLVKIKASFKVPSLKSSISKIKKPVEEPSPSKKLAKPNPAAKSKTKVASQRKAKVASQPKAKVASQPKAKVATKPKARVASKSKIVAKAKPKVTGSKPKALPKSKAVTKPKSSVNSKKVAKTSAKSSPGKKATKPALPKKLKTLKSPVKKAVAAKRTKKTTK